jgi:UDP-4-amino-4,6-dideoxy-N-acetyl-beta-L-altrosamine transaminase
MTMIPYGRQHITRADIDAVVHVLQSDFLTQGPKVPEFEQAVADKAGAKYAVAVNSGTSALHIACLALGLGPGDILWTSPITFAASANCALYCGATVDFVDIDPDTYTLCPGALEKKLKQAKQENRLPKIVIPVHMCGQSCPMAAIHDLSQQYGFRVIEDACHALGGQYKGKPIGGCQYSDITVFSFHPVKLITTGEGGMAVTNDSDLAARMARLRSHGITREPELMTREPDGPWYYQQIDLGFNYRMTDIQAALGLSQLEKLDAFVSRRRELAHRYDRLLADLPVILPKQDPDGASAWHLYVIRLKLDKIRQSHQQVFVALREKGIGVNLHYIPVHLFPWYRTLGFAPGQFPEAEHYYREAMTLPLFYAMTEQDQDCVAASLQDAI